MLIMVPNHPNRSPISKSSSGSASTFGSSFLTGALVWATLPSYFWGALVAPFNYSNS